MKRIFLIFLCLTLLGTLCACRVRLIADPAQADTILQAQQEAQPPQEEEPQPPAQEEPEPPEQESEEEPPAEQTPPDTPPQPDETAQAEQPDTSVSVAQTGTAVYTEQLAAGVTVTYDPNGGDSATVSASVTPGQPYGAQPEAVRRGYAFDGWWTLPDGGEQILPETIVSDVQAHTLYAHWQHRDAATLTLDPNGGRIKSKEATLALSDGDCYGALPIPLREGYDFNGWWTQIEGGEQILPETVFSGTDDRTVYAHWTYDPLAFWTFTLQNKTQQIYLCQQISIYFETETDGVTQQYCDLITATGSILRKTGTIPTLRTIGYRRKSLRSSSNARICRRRLPSVPRRRRASRSSRSFWFLRLRSGATRRPCYTQSWRLPSSFTVTGTRMLILRRPRRS